MVEFTLNGFSIKSPKGWQQTTINASFEDGVQPDISQDSYEFGNDSIAIIDSWISTNGVFRGCPIDIKKDGIIVFNGYLDFNKKFIKVHSNKYIIAVEKDNGLNQFADYVEGYTIGLLDTKVSIPYYSIPYVVEKKTTFIELALLSVTTFILLKESYEAIKRLQDSIINFSTALASPTATAGLILSASLKLVQDIVYTGVILVALKRNITELLSFLISPIRYQKGFKIKEVFTLLFNTLGYNGFDTNITELDNLYYFPSRGEDTVNKGIPQIGDYGYYVPELIDLVKQSFDAKVVIDSTNKVQIRSKNDPYFIRNSTYVMPDILLESKEYNISDLNGMISISFLTDNTDTWTVDNFTGTAFDVFTSTTGTVGTNLVKGLNEIKINACLGSRKDSLNVLEKALDVLASLGDSIINAIGGNSNLSNKITKKIGMLKVGSETWSEPKLLLLNNSLSLNSNNRTLFSAKSCYDNYINYSSFVENNYGGQRKLFTDVEIPFTLIDFQKCIDNSYFLWNGNVAKFTNLKMGLDSGEATADFWIEEIYDKNLIETYVEP